MEANHSKPSNYSSPIMSNKTLDDMLAWTSWINLRNFSFPLRPQSKKKATENCRAYFRFALRCMLLDLPLPMCRAGNKAGDGWMKGIPIDTPNCGGTLNRLLNRLFRTWENELELPVWPMWLRAIMAPYVGGKMPWDHMFDIFEDSQVRISLQTLKIWEMLACLCFGKQKLKMIVWGLRGFHRSKSLAFFTPTFGAPMCGILSLQVHMFQQLELWPRVRFSSFVKVVVDEEQRFKG